MHALVRNASGTLWTEVRDPQLQSDYVLIQVSLVGLCRTDLAVAAGRLAVETPRILGHEFVGRVVETGPDVQEIAIGEKVAADPVLRCGLCDRCASGWFHACRHARFLGVDVDGAIAQWIAVPKRNLWRFPDDVDDRIAALLEPVAACAAVVNAPIRPDDRGVICGSSRLSKMTHMILQSYGFSDVQCIDPDVEVLPNDQYDFAIETNGTTETFERLCECLRPRGELILKSRPLNPVAFDVRRFLPKELSIRAVNYSDFAEARRLLLDSGIDFQSLLGPIWEPGDFGDAFESAGKDERRKHFIRPQTAQHSGQDAEAEIQCVR